MSRARPTLLLVTAVAALSVSHGSFAGGATGCLELPPGREPFTQFRFGQFQAIFDTLTDPKNPNSQLCSSCHPGEFGSGGLGLGNGFSYANLVNVESLQDPTLLRVAPGNPLASLLFQKINCDTPQVGGPMPPEGSLSLTQQALFFDWISAGAPLSKLGFEDR